MGGRVVSSNPLACKRVSVYNIINISFHMVINTPVKIILEKKSFNYNGRSLL